MYDDPDDEKLTVFDWCCILFILAVSVGGIFSFFQLVQILILLYS